MEKICDEKNVNSTDEKPINHRRLHIDTELERQTFDKRKNVQYMPYVANGMSASKKRRRMYSNNLYINPKTIRSFSLSLCTKIPHVYKSILVSKFMANQI